MPLHIKKLRLCFLNKSRRLVLFSFSCGILTVCSWKTGVSSKACRKYKPMMPSGSARKNGMRQPHSINLLSPNSRWSAETIPAPSKNPRIEPKSNQLAIKPRLRSGEYSATKIDAPAYSPPTEKPCAIFKSSRIIGAQIPMESYDGIRPMPKVLSDMTIIVIANTRCRPILSPRAPNTKPPNGRKINGTENVPSAAIVCTLGDASGKKILPSAKATKPYTPKSNHSMALPKAAAEMAFLVSARSIIVISLSFKGLCVLAIKPYLLYL